MFELLGGYEAEKINDNILWYGRNTGQSLNSNSYVIIEEDEYILLDPGPVKDREYILDLLAKKIDIHKISIIIAQNHTPSSCSIISSLQEIGINPTIVTHERNRDFIMHYGINLDSLFLVGQSSNRLSLKSGKELFFIEAPYLPYFESIVTYDSSSKALFSSSLFGAIPRKWKLYADRVFYKESMKSFHEQLVAGNDMIRPIMEILLKLEIEIVAPHHGSVIKDRIERFMKILRELDCGIAINPVKNDLTQKEGFILLCNQVLKFMHGKLNTNEIIEVFENSDIILNDKGLIESFNGNGAELWDKFFVLIHIRKGAKWLTIIMEMVFSMAKKYNIKEPTIFREKEKEVLRIEQENLKLKELNEGLESTKETLTKCSITKLYNQNFFQAFLQTAVDSYREEDKEFSLLFMEIDHLSDIRIKYGKERQSVYDGILKTMTYSLEQMRESSYQLFKLANDTFVFYLPSMKEGQTNQFAEVIRNNIERSERFIEKITISIGVVTKIDISPEIDAAELIYLGLDKLKYAKKLGMNIVCNKIDQKAALSSRKRILIADPDESYLQVLVVSFMENKYDVFSCTDGMKALEIIETQSPDLVISEIFLPISSGFVLKETMLTESDKKNIPFILMSHKKDQDSVQRALSLKINHFFKKPVPMYELLGTVQNLFSQ